MTGISGTPSSQQRSEPSSDIQPPRQRLRLDSSALNQGNASQALASPEHADQQRPAMASVFATAPTNANQHIFPNKALNDDVSSRVLPNNWQDGGRYPINPEAGDEESIANLNMAALAFHSGFVAPFVPDNTIDPVNPKAENRYYSQSSQDNFEGVRNYQINTTPERPSFDCTVYLMNEFADLHMGGVINSVLALNSHDLSAYVFSQFVEATPDTMSAIIMTPSISPATSPAIPPATSPEENDDFTGAIATDGAHCFVVIGDFDKETNLLDGLLGFDDLDADDELCKLAVIDMYNREVFSFSDLQDKLNALDNPEQRVTVDQLTILDTSANYSERNQLESD